MIHLTVDSIDPKGVYCLELIQFLPNIGSIHKLHKHVQKLLIHTFGDQFRFVFQLMLVRSDMRNGRICKVFVSPSDAVKTNDVIHSNGYNTCADHKSAVDLRVKNISYYLK